MNRGTGVFLKMLMVLCLAALHSGVMAADLSGQLVINGSDTVEPLIVDMAKSFMNSNKGVKIVVHGGGSGKGVADARSGVANIGMVSRALTSQESVDLHAFNLAYDGICFVSSKKNPVQNLTAAQLEGIFLGKITNWKDVGGSNLPITVVVRDRLSSSNKVVAEFLGVRESDLKGKVINDADVAMRTASQDPKVLAYVSSGEAFHEKLSGMPINIMSISGKKPSLKSIARNSYPLARPLTLVTKGEASPLAKAFISYCQSKTVASVIRSHNFVVPE